MFPIASQVIDCVCARVFEMRKCPDQNNLWLAFNQMPSKHRGLNCLLVIRQRRLCGIALFIVDLFRPRLICLLFSTFCPFLMRMTCLPSVCHCVEFPSILHSLFTILALTASLFPFYVHMERLAFIARVSLPWYNCEIVHLAHVVMVDARGRDWVFLEAESYPPSLTFCKMHLHALSVLAETWNIFRSYIFSYSVYK